ncbi:MAG: hypothetical protein FD149_2594 [Rhodospirillaceae bacterium]|nr:MAG: hypothetical protein FD149_2594 [Rhodospirillaceae bacterium]
MVWLKPMKEHETRPVTGKALERGNMHHCARRYPEHGGCRMKKLNAFFAATVVVGVSALTLSSADAWWGGGPFDGTGDGGGDFNMNFSGRSNAYGQGYESPYSGGYGPWGGYPSYGYGGPWGGGYPSYGYGGPWGGGYPSYGYGGPYSGGSPYGGGGPYSSHGPWGGGAQQAPAQPSQERK